MRRREILWSLCLECCNVDQKVYKGLNGNEELERKGEEGSIFGQLMRMKERQTGLKSNSFTSSTSPS